MKKYDEHFLLDVNTVKDFVFDMDLFQTKENLESLEIGDGNINYVFKVYDTVSNKSLIVKQADKLLRSSQRPFNMHRNKIEYDILNLNQTLVEKLVPKMYFYHEKMYAMVMEDVSRCKNLRKQLMDGKCFNHLADSISSYIAKTTIVMSDLVLASDIKKENVKKFTNIDCCDISEDLVFTEPYNNYKNRNIIKKENLEFVKENIYDNKKLRVEVGILRNKYMNNSQSLIHGDLHSGSIFIIDNELKVIDPEFAFYGPIGYDIGNVIGNLYFSLFYTMYNHPERKEFITWIQKEIVDIYDLCKNKLRSEMDEHIDNSVYNDDFQNIYLDEIMSDTLGYAGCEMIRRVVGDSKVEEISSIDNVLMEQDIILQAIKLILNRNEINKKEFLQVGGNF
ncbi:MAG: S-methyl-5-thioribose kinase [Anaerorhabdus sp.]